MSKRIVLKVLDARSAHRAWSRRRTLMAALAVALAAVLSSPAVIRANELDAELPCATQPAAADSDPKALAADEPAATEASKEEPADAAPAAEGAAGLPTQAEPTQAEPASDPAPAHAEEPADSRQETLEEKVEGKEADSLGTKVIFDFNGDGTTDASDWKAYLKWLSEFRPFDFNLETGDLGDSHNGGIQITGATQIIANGNARRLDSIDTNLDITKISRYYLNNVGQATSVKNQAQWGTCWSFASISALESAILKAQAGDQAQVIDPSAHLTPILTDIDDKGVDLSELYLAWMAYDLQAKGSQKGEGIVDVLPVDDEWDRLACGGWATMAETLFTAWQATAAEADQPYWPHGVPKTFEEFVRRVKNNSKWGVDKGKDKVNFHVDNVYYLPDPNTFEVDKRDHIVYKGHNDYADTVIKQALVKYGAVQIGYGADTAREGNTANGQYFNVRNWAQYCDAKNIEITHAVTIVGWDDDYDPQNFKTEGNDVTGLRPGAWLVKNSWGSADWFKTNFGLSDQDIATKPGVRAWGIVDPKTGQHTGYFWLSYYDHSINTPSVFTVDMANAEGKFKYDNNYSYDLLINESQSPFVLRTADAGTWVSNVFKAEGDETLRAVTVHTSEPNSHAVIRIYLVNEDGLLDSDPTNDGGMVLEMSYDALLAGFHTVELDKPIRLKKGQLFAIVENIINPSDDRSVEGTSLLNLETGMSQSAQFPDPNNKETFGRAMGYLWSTAKANPGETFVNVLTKLGRMWLTPEQLSKTFYDGNVFEFGNALIKALTTNGFDEEQLPPAPQDEPSVQVIAENASGATVVHGAAAMTKSAPAEQLPQTGDESSVQAALAFSALAVAFVSSGVAMRRRHQD